MRAHRVVCPVGTTVIPMDYFNATWALQFVPTGGATYSVSYTADDPNDTENQGVVPTWFPFPTALTGATTNQYFPGFIAAGGPSATPQPMRAIQIIVTVAGTVAVTILQPSGDGSG